MDNVNRRGFLRGLIASTSAAAGTALVQLAAPEEITALSKAEPVLIGHPPILDMPVLPFEDMSVWMKGKDGRFFQVGWLTDISARSPDPIDISLASDVNQRFVRGLGPYRWQGRFEGSR